MKRKLLLFLLLFNCKVIQAYPGFVSRDCPTAGAKESITIDWTMTARRLYTISKHKKFVKTVEVYPIYSSTPCYEGTVCYDLTWRSYAGTFGRIFENSYVAGVWGYHYWDNPYRQQKERRLSYAIDCNLESWGYDNWDRL